MYLNSISEEQVLGFRVRDSEPSMKLDYLQPGVYDLTTRPSTRILNSRPETPHSETIRNPNPRKSKALKEYGFGV